MNRKKFLFFMALAVAVVFLAGARSGQDPEKSAPRRRLGGRFGGDHFQKNGNDQAGLPAGDLSRSAATADYQFQWNTFMGGEKDDEGNCIAVDGHGHIYILGTSKSSWGNPLRPYGGGSSDAFVAKFAANGARLWHTFLGLDKWDQGRGIAVDGSGNIYMIGRNYLAKLDANGVFKWHAHVQANELETIAVDSQGNIYVTGYYECSGSGDLWNETIVYKFDSDGIGKELTGWTNYDWMNVYGLTVDNSGNIYLTGWAYTAFLMKLNKYGDEQWKRYFIKYKSENRYNDSAGFGISVDPRGNIFVVGTINSQLDSVGYFYDAFVAKLDAGGKLQRNTFLGGAGDDYGSGIALGNKSDIYVLGRSSEYIWGKPLNPHHGGFDVFVAELDARGALQWNTFLGGSDYDRGNGMALDNEGKIYVTGNSHSAWGSPRKPFSGSNDSFVAKLTNNSIKVTSPNGGESWKAGGSHVITWSSKGSIAKVNIDYSIDDGSHWLAVAAGTRNDGRYDWVIPDTPSAICLVRISDVADLIINGTSHSVFAIQTPVDLQVERLEIRAFSILRQYAAIQFSVGNVSVVDHCLVLRQKGSELPMSIRAIAAGELTANLFQMQDRYLDKRATYTYWVEAYDADDRLIGISNKITI